MTICHTPNNARTPNLNDFEYNQWVSRMNVRFAAIPKDTPLFMVDVPSLFTVYLSTFNNPEEQQYHNCHACKEFINHYGRLVTIDENGQASSAIWDLEETPAPYKYAIAVMLHTVTSVIIKSVFYTAEKQWGKRVTGEWTHFAITPPAHRVHTGLAQTAFQKIADKTTDFDCLRRAAIEFKLETVETAVQLLRSEALYRSEKVLGPAEWFLNVLQRYKAAKLPGTKDKILWHAVASAPVGWAHVRSSMAGTLLEDIQAGIDMETVKRRFAEKMHPLQYQRPSAPPAEGTIDQAEKLVEKLGVATSLKRRYASPQDVAETLWRPTEPQGQPEESRGLFGHLRDKNVAAERPELPQVTMTWVKFARTMLPDTVQIEVLMHVNEQFCVLLTAEDPNAPPILQWDCVEQRNPVSWYFWHNGAPVRQFGFAKGQYVRVWAITRNPCHWFGNKEPNTPENALLLLNGAHETKTGGLALFPGTLKSELHGIRSVVEAYSREGTLGNQDGEHVVSLGVNARSLELRVTTKLGIQLVKIDRWD